VGYFDALARSSFKTAADGRRFFFPYGTLGRGYAIPGEDEFRRLRQGVKTYYMVGLPVGLAAVALAGPWGMVMLPVLILPYVVWAGVRCRGLQPTDERLTVGEAWRAHIGSGAEPERTPSPTRGIGPGA
jgi:hypothetical protein